MDALPNISRLDDPERTKGTKFDKVYGMPLENNAIFSTRLEPMPLILKAGG